MNFDPTPYPLLTSVLQWAAIFGAFVGIVLFVSFLTALLVKGVAGVKAMGRSIGNILRELVLISPRRVGALASLTIKEAIRRKALLVFVLFAILFMFAGWFLNDAGDRDEFQVKVYVSFVLKTISWLTIPVVLLLACWGLPEDIRLRSLHTVVTKPARRNEIVIGRMLGFITVGTIVLLVMGGVGYVWLNRQLPDDVREKLVCRVPVYGSLSFLDREGKPSKKGINAGDTWDFRSYIEGATRAAAIWEFDDITPERVGDELNFEARFESFRTHKGNMEGGLVCRLFFTNLYREDVGNILAGNLVLEDVAPVWQDGQFSGVADELDEIAEDFASNSVAAKPSDIRDIATRFRSINEVIEPLASKYPEATWVPEFVAASEEVAAAAESSSNTGLDAALKKLAGVVRSNPDAMSQIVIDWRVPYRPFEVKEYRDLESLVKVPRELPYTREGQSTTVDIFDTIVRDGKLRVEARCLDAGQLLGMARPDLFIRTPDRDFWIGYSKAIFGTWLMLVLIVVIGVSASTFLKGPVATLLTMMFVLVGSLFRAFLDKLLSGQMEGSGTVESAIRLARHLNPTAELNVGKADKAVQAVDSVLGGHLWLAEKVIPDFAAFSQTTEYVANGFDVPFSAGILPCIATTLGFLVPCLLIGHFALKMRELEAK